MLGALVSALGLTEPASSTRTLWERFEFDRLIAVHRLVAPMSVGLLAIAFAFGLRGRTRAIALTLVAIGLLVFRYLCAPGSPTVSWEYAARYLQVGLEPTTYPTRLLMSLGLVGIIVGLSQRAAEHTSRTDRVILGLGALFVGAALANFVEVGMSGIGSEAPWPRDAALVLVFVLALLAGIAACTKSPSRGLRAARRTLWVAAIAWPVLLFVMLVPGLDASARRLLDSGLNVIEILGNYGFLLILVSGIVGWIGSRPGETAASRMVSDSAPGPALGPAFGIATLGIVALVVWLFLPFARAEATVRVTLDFEHARNTGRLAPDEDDDAVMTDVRGVFEDRIRRLDGQMSSWTEGAELPSADGTSRTVEMTIRGLPPERFPVLRRALESNGDVQFLIEVRPNERYEVQPDTPLPLRLAQPPYPWPDSTAAFDAYKREEVQRWLTSSAARTAYQPSRSDMFVVPHRGRDPETDSDFAVVEAPGAVPQDGRILKAPRVGSSPWGGRVVNFDLRPTYERGFTDFTAENVGLPLAIVLDGECVSIPRIMARLTGSVQITVGQGGAQQQATEAEALALVLQTGALKVRARVVSITPTE